MKISIILPLAVGATAFVIPDKVTSEQLRLQPDQDSVFWSRLPSKDVVRLTVSSALSHAAQESRNVLDHALSVAVETGKETKNQIHCLKSWAGLTAQAWLDSAEEMVALEDADGELQVSEDDHGHHGHHDHKPNMTVYQLISESKYTTKLAKLINDDEGLVRVLNSTDANYTVFAPTDHAFEKIPKHGEEPSKELIKKVLLYHVSPDFYPAGRVLVSHTIPTLLKEETLGDNPQRIRIGLGLKGLQLNFYSRVVAINIFGTNGVIHGIDDVLIPPMKTLSIFDHLPSMFSTLELGLIKTGLWDDFQNTEAAGGTFFAPTNFAFQKLGPHINAFLFSKRGEKYLKALLKYHVAPDRTLYSDAFYASNEVVSEGVPQGYFHVDLPTLLEDHSLGVDVARYGAFISIKINGFSRVTIQDGVAKDGVIQAVGNVLIPPKKLGGEAWQGEELTTDDLMERLAPFAEEDMEL